MLQLSAKKWKYYMTCEVETVYYFLGQTHFFNAIETQLQTYSSNRNIAQSEEFFFQFHVSFLQPSRK